MSERTETEREAVEEDTRPGTADLVREAEEVEAGADETRRRTPSASRSSRRPTATVSARAGRAFRPPSSTTPAMRSRRPTRSSPS